MYRDIARITDVANDETLVRADTSNKEIVLRITETQPDNRAYAVYNVEQARELIKALQAAVRRVEPDVSDKVVALWNGQGGWIPGASYARLAEVLGVDTDRLIHWDPTTNTRHRPNEE